MYCNQFMKSVFKEGPLKGVPIFELCGMDKTHKLDLSNDFMSADAFVILILPGSFGQSIEKYLARHHPTPGKFYTYTLTNKKMFNNKDIPGLKHVVYNKKMPIGKNLVRKYMK